MLALDKRAKTILFLVAIVVVISVATYIKYGGPISLQPQGPGGPIPGGIKVVDPQLQTGPFNCPSTKEFCQLGKQVTKNGLMVGFGATVATGSPVLATFDGHIQSLEATLPQSLGGEKLTVIYLDSAERYLRTVYYFKGTAAKNNAEVKEGEEIGKTAAAISYYDGVTLMIQMIKNDPATGEKLKLTPQNFK